MGETPKGDGSPLGDFAWALLQGAICALWRASRCEALGPVDGGIREAETGALLRDFFEERR